MLKKIENNRLFENLFLLSVTILLYGWTVGFDFVWDDRLLILKNPFLENEQSLSFLKLFQQTLWKFTPMKSGNYLYYRPLLTVFYVFEYSVFGKIAAYYHLINVGLFAGIVLLLNRIAFLLQFDFKKRMIACLFFTLHPVQASTVSFISCQGDLFALLFMLLSLYFWTFRTRWKWMSFLWMVMGMLFKEAAVVTPVILILHDIFIGKKTYKDKATWLPMLAWLPYFLLRNIATQDRIISNSIAEVFTSSASYQFFMYMGRILLPFPISPKVNFENVSAFQGLFFHALLLIIVLGLFYRYRKNTMMLFFLGWSCISTFLVLDWFKLGIRYSDQLLFHAMIPLSLLIAFLFSDKSKFIMPLFFIFPLYGMLSFEESSVWKNNIRLWERIVSFEPENMENQFQYAISLKDGGKKEEGCNKLLEMEKVFQPMKESAFYHATLQNLGNCYFNEDPKMAEYYFREFLKLEDFSAVRRNLVVLLINQKRSAEALAEAKRLTDLSPEYFHSWKLLGIAYLMNKDEANALKAFQKAATFSKDAEVTNAIRDLETKVRKTP
jgi:tetratricopeptide (TPR) repeat protein